MTEFLSSFKKVIELMEQHQIPYMVVGSVASTMYGEPRLTNDMDMVIELVPGLAPKMQEIFPPQAYYLPPLEIIASEARECGQINLIVLASGLKVDFIFKKPTDHSGEEFRRRRRLPLLKGFDVYVAAPEDVIIKKLAYFKEGGSEKHLKDIRSVAAHTPLDAVYLKEWLNRLSLMPEWEKTLLRLDF